jgi:hypothetical protein
MQFFSLLTLLAIILFPLGQLTRSLLFSSEVVLYWHDLVIALAILTKINQLPKIVKSNLHFMGFFVFSIFSLILSTSLLPLSEVLTGSLYLVRWTTYTLFFFLLVQNDENLLKKRLSSYLVVAVILTLIGGFLQYFLFPSFESIFALGWDRHAFRFAGPWLDVNFTGLLLTLMILWLLNKFKTKTGPFYLHTLVVTAFIGLLLTYSRGSYLAFFTGITVFFYLKKKTYIAIGLCALVLVGILLLPRKIR